MRDYSIILRENIDKYNFSDLFDTKELQIFQDQFAEVLSVAMVMMDSKGTEVTNRSNFQDFCRSARGQLKKLEPCISATINRQKKAYTTKGYGIYHCPVANLLYAIVNIRIGEIYIGDWYIGQVRDEAKSPDWEKLADMGICVDGEMEKELERNSVSSKSHFEASVKLISMFANNLSKSTMQRYIQKEEAERHNLLEKEMEKQNEQLLYENSYDMLTNTRSRNYFYKKLKEMQDQEELLPISLVVGDVNNLKFTNDLFGHRHGDLLLSTIGRILLEEAEADGYMVGRCGGDEFIIAMPNALRRDANWYCHRVNLRLAEVKDCCLPPVISFGVAKKSDMNDDLFRLIETADAKMYRNKMEFKSHYDIFKDIEQLLYRRGFLTPECVEKRIELVSGFCEYIGYSRLKGEELKELTRCHDLGLTIVPERIFYKPGSERNKREWQEIHKHPGIGAKLLLLHPSLAEFGGSIAYSHENWDGTGYPRKFKGEEIDRLARVFRIIDDYVEFTGKEPVGRGKTFATARRMISSGAGTLYDPEMVERFLEYIVTVEK